MIGTEHEYSINDKNFNPLPISDQIIRRICGAVEHEVGFGEIKISKELQKHAIEIIPCHPGGLSYLESVLHRGLCSLLAFLNWEYKFLGLGMHPLLTLDKTTFWDHEEQEVFQAYNRLFNIKQHGWLNIQALQINIPYQSEEDLVSMFNRIRALIPYLVAISASSPFVEGKLAPHMDSRLVYYRENQRRIPLICNGIIPEKIGGIEDYIAINREIYRELKECRAGILCREWVNSRGVIVRFTRKCLEIKALDEQECLHSDMAVAAFILSLIRSPLSLDDDENVLRSLLEKAIKHGVQDFEPELEQLYKIAFQNSSEEERRYLPLIQKRIWEGSLSELLVRQFKEIGRIEPLLEEMSLALRDNRPFLL